MTIPARKRFGQNFLHDRHVIHKIIEAITPEQRSHIIEIGPGRGALTFPLLSRAAQFTAIEIDRDLVALLKEQAPKPFQLIEGDILKVDLHTLLTSSATKPVIVGNLPYNISTPLLFHLLQYRNAIDEMFFMLQKEVVLRMAAEPKTKEYGRLSVMMQYFCEVEPLFTVPPGAFTPVPAVDSMAVRLKPYSSSPFGIINDFSHFEKIVMLGFNQRRKTLRNALKSTTLLLPPDLAERRAEELSIQDWVNLSLI